MKTVETKKLNAETQLKHINNENTNMPNR